MGALDFGLLDVLDIFLAGYLFYQLYQLLKGTAAFRILLGMLAIYLVYNLVQVLEMKLLSELLGSFISAGLVLLIIVFQQEIRKFLLVIGSATFSSRRGLLRSLVKFRQTEEDPLELYQPVVEALTELATSKTGVLVVIERNDPLGSFVESGNELDAKLSKIALEALFYKNSPLHDGAAILAQGRIKSAGSILPVNYSKELPTQFGLRHRAASGIAERTDAVAITVSEETGGIHLFHDGSFQKIEPKQLATKLFDVLSV